jgi:DnaK suppressor protein
MDVQTQMHLKAFRELLQYRLNELRGTVNADRVAFMDAAAGDSAANDQSCEAQLRSDIDELARVELALHRLDNGLYGACDECGQAIGYHALLARPDTPRCAACEAKRDEA